MEKAMQMTGETLTEEQIKTLKKSFQAIDLDRDGRIGERDLNMACRKLGILLSRDELKAMIKEADKDRNGFIEYREFERLMAPRLIIANFKTKQLQLQFRRFDKDGDGFITGEEIRTVLRSEGVEITDEEVTQLIIEADTNGDGKISFEEFVNSVCEKDW
ncbi:calmodulin-like isoform X1 [Dreissena polymorpha]|uniref:Sulfhydryl light chain n=1 Tax=Dreissena polymorpha TaxID=45954 RepID=A0A9D4DGQ0_DREPO|nr:calmodulin-like isoform X1 [Dreissena polymorpha]XP_052236612.1 calmodulin-like isoform X1 [Dreissena polymorpha]KAH3748501.1 hypothetical protein DPMN_182947 [Dreissena polymorpha]